MAGLGPGAARASTMDDANGGSGARGDIVVPPPNAERYRVAYGYYLKVCDARNQTPMSFEDFVGVANRAGGRIRGVSLEAFLEVLWRQRMRSQASNDDLDVVIREFANNSSRTLEDVANTVVRYAPAIVDASYQGGRAVGTVAGTVAGGIGGAVVGFTSSAITAAGSGFGAGLNNSGASESGTIFGENVAYAAGYLSATLQAMIDALKAKDRLKAGQLAIALPQQSDTADRGSVNMGTNTDSPVVTSSQGTNTDPPVASAPPVSTSSQGTATDPYVASDQGATGGSSTNTARSMSVSSLGGMSNDTVINTRKAYNNFSPSLTDTYPAPFSAGGGGDDVAPAQFIANYLNSAYRPQQGSRASGPPPPDKLQALRIKGHKQNAPNLSKYGAQSGDVWSRLARTAQPRPDNGSRAIRPVYDN